MKGTQIRTLTAPTLKPARSYSPSGYIEGISAVSPPIRPHPDCEQKWIIFTCRVQLEAYIEEGRDDENRGEVVGEQLHGAVTLQEIVGTLAIT